MRPPQVDHEARTEDLQWMAACGESAVGAAARLGLTHCGLWKWCRDNGLTDVWAVLNARDPHDWNQTRKASA